MAAVALIVVQSIMPATAIVPKGHRARAPAKTASETFLTAMLEQKIEQWFAFMAVHILET